MVKIDSIVPAAPHGVTHGRFGAADGHFVGARSPNRRLIASVSASFTGVRLPWR